MKTPPLSFPSTSARQPATTRNAGILSPPRSLLRPLLALLLPLLAPFLLLTAPLAQAEPADEPANTDPVPTTNPARVNKPATDLETAPRQQERAVARAVLELQKQLGGPLAQKSDLLQPLPEDPRHPNPGGNPIPQRQWYEPPGQGVPRRPVAGRYPPERHAPHPRGPYSQPPGLYTPPTQPRPQLPIPPRVAPRRPASEPGRPPCHGPLGLDRHDAGQRCDHHPGSCLPAKDKPVELLRETASGLDRSANRLEWANLYDEADAMRELAQALRLEARKRQKSSSPDS